MRAIFRHHVQGKSKEQEEHMYGFNLYTKYFKYHGFTVNPYYICTPNSIIDGKQCTIAWYVDDNKLLHIDEEMNLKIIETISQDFG